MHQCLFLVPESHYHYSVNSEAFSDNVHLHVGAEGGPWCCWAGNEKPFYSVKTKNM